MLTKQQFIHFEEKFGYETAMRVSETDSMAEHYSFSEQERELIDYACGNMPWLTNEEKQLLREAWNYFLETVASPQ